MTSISSMARFKSPTRSSKGPSFSGTGTIGTGRSSLRRSGSMGSLTKRSSANIAANFGTGSGTMKSTKGSDYDNLEAEYIKNLQQQIYFLELEANFLRDQAKKATELQPRMTEEASKMLHRLKDLQSDVDSLHLEVRRKESNLDMVSTEKERLDGKVRMLSDSHHREKKLLVEEVVQLKKQNEMIQREIHDREQQISMARGELEKGSSSLSTAEHRIQMLESEVQQKADTLRATQLALEEKRTDLLKTQTQLQEMEDKYYSSTASIQDQAVNEFREEIRQLQRKLKETEMKAEQDRFLKSKMSEDVNNLVKENAMMGAQVLELQKQLDREKMLRESRDTRHSTHITELVTVKDKEKQLKFDLDQARESLKQERERVAHLMKQLSKQDERQTHNILTHNTTKSRLAELEGRQGGVEQENAQLRRDKMLLVDHVSDLQKQLAEKEHEVMRLHSHIHTLEIRLDETSRQSVAESSIQTQKWSEFEKMAESMKKLSQSMTTRSITPEYS
ncbi:intraflagellar transport protein 74 homolog [Lytechinus pictus]|uniref:intraflagellar transport protein 74 homolog n=1 Tax=Lytechinus pictus TaxID=7653 RepID=UPI0030B9BF5E